MIWFGNVERLVVHPDAESLGFASETKRMRTALERVAEATPGLWGPELLDALVATGWVDRTTAESLLPQFRHFDPDRHFAEHMRRLSFRGTSATEEFRAGVRCVINEIAGNASVDRVGPEHCVRFAPSTFEGIVLAHPEVSFTITGRTREAITAAVEEAPDAIVVVARNFDPITAVQLRSLLDRTGVPGTLVTVNMLLGLRATALRYQPKPEQVVHLLSRGGMLRSADIARLGDRAA
ncbi:MAG: hypothetical protein LBG44_08140 [Gemmatimonadota bacterium]|jgi:hypothetical protein|nr:hypothetical protein [Gemmatimonadota bacterium]